MNTSSVCGLLMQSIALLGAAVLTGCASGPKFTSPRVPREDAALIYVFRPNNPPLLRPSIRVNGVRVAELTNKGYFDLELDPGVYVIEADWSWHSGVPDGNVALTVQRGGTYYVMVDTTLHMIGLNMARYEAWVGVVNSEAAVKLIPSCGAVPKVSGIEGSIRPK